MLMVLQKIPPIQHLHMRLEWTEFQIAHWDRPKHLALKTEAPVLPNDPFKWRKRSSLRLGVLCGLSVLLLEHLLVLCWSGSTRRAKQSESQPGPAAHCPVAANTPITWCVLPECGSVSIQRAVQIWICAARTTNQCSVSVQGGLGGALLTAKQALYGDEDRSHIVYSGPFLLQRRREHAQSVSQPWACVCASSTHL